ncbi:MAG: MBL fold metallo-hydrolase RNA specificity domain-containing protein [Thermoproteota archaeon]
MSREENLSLRLDRFTTISIRNGKLYLGSKIEDDYRYFISHAHLDHVNKPGTHSLRAICSEETFILLALRGVRAELVHENRLRLLDSGHILGSKALVVETDFGSILYTGDVNNSPAGGLRRQSFPKTRILIIESNYGRPNLVFPPRSKLVSEIADYVCEALRRNSPVVLMGYPLGKSQHLQMLLDPVTQGFEVYCSPSIIRYNEVYGLFSMKISEKKVFSPDSGLPKDDHWILYYPNVSGRSALMQFLRKKKNAILISFSGRFLLGNYEETMAVDKAFPLSDHADFNGLLSIVKETEPEVVFTIHGFSKEFSEELRRLGYDSQPLGSREVTIS